MAASGGCGEIFRNFFYLPDRRLSAAAVARTFFVTAAAFGALHIGFGVHIARRHGG